MFIFNNMIYNGTEMGYTESMKNDIYTCTVWIDGQMVHLTGQDAIEYLTFIAENC